MQNKLLPCPFCGGKAEISNEEFIRGHFVFCKQCHIQTKLYTMGNTSEQAINDWNTRKPMERIMEQFEKDTTCRDRLEGYIPKHKAIEIVKGGVDNATN